MLVRVVRDWQYPEKFFRQFPAGKQDWDGITFTEEEVKRCDYIIVLQRPPSKIKVRIPEGNAWLISQEPPVGYFNFHKKAFPYFDKVFSYYRDLKYPKLQSMQPVLPWHVNRTYDQLSEISLKDLAHKKEELVWITSNKNAWPGHKARMLFKEVLCNAGVSFHLMGNGFEPIADKFDGLFPYKYAIAIENFSCEDYWTEKLADCFLSWCLPFYWGAPNILKYFPEKSFISLDPNSPDEALKIIEETIANKEWEKRLDAIAEARDLVLNRYQFFPFVANMIKKDIALKEDKVEKLYQIPANPYPKHYIIRNHIKYYINRLLNCFHLP